MDTTILILVIAVVVIGGIVGVGLAMGVFRVERVTQKTKENKTESLEQDHFLGQQLPQEPEYHTAFSSEPAQPEPYGDEENAQTGDPEELPEDERVNLFTYFAEEEEAPPAVQEEVLNDPDKDFDKLCGFKVGRSFLVDCQKVLNMALADERVYAVAYFDLDRFRFINSLRGVSQGDFVLSRLAQDMTNIFPDGAVFTRVSADHFAVMFPLLDETILPEYADQLKRAADRIRESVGAKSNMRVCMGVATTGNNPREYDITKLMQKANIARHCLKGSRTDSFGVFDDSMLDTRLYGESAMEDFTENQFDDEFVLYFYPIYDLIKGRITGFDALCRWTCVDDHYKKIPLTPDNGRLPTNNAKILYHTCRWMGRWRKAGKEILLGSVYMPVTDLFKDDVDTYVAKCLAAFQVEERTLVVEVDVGAIKVDWSIASHQLKKLKDLGIKICVVGIDRGFTSLDMLAGLPVDYVKLHRSFVSGIEKNDPERMDAVRQIIEMASSLNLRTIFEGVDEKEQADFLRKAGANMVQGRYVGTADIPDEFVRNLQEYVQTRSGTKILDDEQLAKGNFRVF